MKSAKASNVVAQLDDQRQKIDVDNFDITVQELVRMTVEKQIIRAPVYQRKFRWSDTDQSRLIESILLGLPVPTIYVAQNKDGTWDLVDGLQRLSTLMHFVAEPEECLQQINADWPLKLIGLNDLTTFNGLTFAELPPAVRLKFLKRPLRVTALSDKAVYEIRFDVFERLNKGGISLTEQEVRACIYSGEFMQLIGELAEYENFTRLLKLKIGSEHDGTREELVLKFFAYLNDRKSFSHSVRDFLNAYTEKTKDDFDVEGMSGVFRMAADALAENCPVPLTRESSNISALNQIEAALVASAELIASGVDVVKPGKGWLDDVEFWSNSSVGTNTRAKLNARINRAKQLLQGVEPVFG